MDSHSSISSCVCVDGRVEGRAVRNKYLVVVGMLKAVVAVRSMID